ncbi:transposase [Penicillium citrinum]|uniref:Transposase n=1 Tax=Penicillium citrinum TaxID=5077 RepID=A0A9W9ND78_PENCI|nr:transposase [Penicillium citrinum]KAJ5217725.1 transposase [Penicillium citrinum]
MVSPRFDENDVIQACEAARAAEKPILAALARQFKVPYNVLRGCICLGAGPRYGRKAPNMGIKCLPGKGFDILNRYDATE